MKKKLLDVIGTILLFIGFVLALLPHALHGKIGIGESISHTKHVVTGIILVVLALSILVYNNQALNVKAFKLKK